MRKWLVIAGLALVVVTALLSIQLHSPPGGSTRAVQLVITGPDGQRFTGNYTADGRTNILSGVVPTTISVRVKDLTYSFQAEDRREGFRVALDVENLHRTSFTSYQGAPVKGGWRCWSYDFRKLTDMVLSGDIFKKRWSYWISGESAW